MLLLSHPKGMRRFMKSKTKVRVIGSLLSVLVIAAMFWFMLPPLNPTSPDFWIFVLLSIGVFVVLLGLGEMTRAEKTETTVTIGGGKVHMPGLPALPKVKYLKILLFIMGGIAVLMLLASLFGSELFHASRYKQLLTKTDGNFSDDVAELKDEQIPVVDRDTASQLGRRKLGEMSDLVSQFEIAENYTQINLSNRPVRVTPLVYGDIFKWFNNQQAGIPAYIQVDMVTQETTLVRLEQGMKYAPCEFLLRDLQRHLRFHYPTKIFDTFSFEVDENGTPYWVAPTVRYRIGLWNGRDIEGAVLVNAVTGDHRFYSVEDIPTWVDQVYSANLILEQLNWNGKYQSGFWNSYFGQKGVLRTTEGYNYIAVNDDVYLYTGMTSVVSDQSNVGFVLVNMRTKGTKFYSISGAEEISAMSSAQGQVQDQGYRATFPLLLNVADRPTYFMALKDNAGLVKMFAFVDVKRYNLVGLGATVDEARTDYIAVLSKEEGIDTGNSEQTGVISEIYNAVVGGNTKYYLKLENDDTVYMADIKIWAELPFLKAGDAVILTTTGKMAPFEVTSIKRG